MAERPATTPSRRKLVRVVDGSGNSHLDPENILTEINGRHSFRSVFDELAQLLQTRHYRILHVNLKTSADTPDQRSTRVQIDGLILEIVDSIAATGLPEPAVITYVIAEVQAARPIASTAAVDAFTRLPQSAAASSLSPFISVDEAASFFTIPARQELAKGTATWLEQHECSFHEKDKKTFRKKAFLKFAGVMYCVTPELHTGLESMLAGQPPAMKERFHSARHLFGTTRSSSQKDENKRCSARGRLSSAMQEFERDAQLCRCAFHVLPCRLIQGKEWQPVNDLLQVLQHLLHTQQQHLLHTDANKQADPGEESPPTLPEQGACGVESSIVPPCAPGIVPDVAHKELYEALEMTEISDPFTPSVAAIVEVRRAWYVDAAAPGQTRQQSFRQKVADIQHGGARLPFPIGLVGQQNNGNQDWRWFAWRLPDANSQNAQTQMAGLCSRRVIAQQPGSAAPGRDNKRNTASKPVVGGKRGKLQRPAISSEAESSRDLC